MFVVGIVIEWAFVARLKGPEKTAMSILVTYAISLVIEGSLNEIYSVNDVQLSAWYVNKSFLLFGVYFPYIYVFGFLLAAGLLSSLYFMLYRTRFGASIRASLADQSAAALVGIDVKKVSTICFGIGVAVTAAGGMIYGATNTFNASTSYDLITRLLTIIVLGGMGSLGGALVAGILMVTLEDLVGVVWSPIWSTMSFFIVLVIVLSIRPQGLFGQQSARVA
jgi:branched-chain amino acid transport system permease protein